MPEPPSRASRHFGKYRCGGRKSCQSANGLGHLLRCFFLVGVLGQRDYPVQHSRDRDRNQNLRNVLCRCSNHHEVPFAVSVHKRSDPQELDGHRGQKADWSGVVREIRQVVVASRNAYALAFPDVVLRDLVTRFEVFYGIDEPAPVALFLSCELLDELVHLAMRKADVRSFDFGFSDDRRVHSSRQ